MLNQGRVKEMKSRGYGFIETPEEIDFFMHYKDYVGNWKQLLARFVAGDIITVSFDIATNNPQGPRAVNIKLVSCLTAPMI